MKKLDDLTVLITGAGAPGAPGIIKSLRIVKERKIRIIGVDIDIENSVGIGLVDASYTILPPENDEFIPALLSVCKKENVRVLLPLVTRELQVLSENIKLFEKNNIALRVSEPEQLKTANNKYSLMSFCRDNYIPVPDFYLVNSKDDFIKKSEMLGYPERQICFKPPVSNGLRGFRIISDSINRMNVIMNEKPNNVFIGFEEFLQIADESKWFPQLLLMEYLPGEEYSVDVLANRGKCIKVIPRLRDKLKMGISFVGTVVKEEQIIGYSGRLVERLGLDGNIGLQFRKDANGIPKIIESNPRLQGTVILCTAAGYNMVYNSVKLAVGEMPEEAELRWGTKMIRYWEELFVLNQKPFDLQ